MRQYFGIPLSSVLWALFVVVNISGCASPGKRLEPPQISLANIEIEETKIFETVLKIDLRVFNTNQVALEVKGVDCKLELNGKDFARGVSDIVTRIPANGTGIIPVIVYSSLVDMARGLFRAQAEEKLQYTIKGRLRVEGGFLMPSVVPFSEDGEIMLGNL